MEELLLFSTTSFGIDNYTLLLILFLPIAATIVGFARHFVGVKTLSMYAPIVLTYALIEIAFNRETSQIDFWDGAVYGTAAFFVVFTSSTATYKVIRKLRLHYFPKITLVFTSISFTILLLFALAAQLDIYEAIRINIFSLVLIAAVSERLVASYARKDFKHTFNSALETFGLALFNLFLISWQDFRLILLSQPWIILGVVLANIYIGRYTGLRLREFWRFRSILNEGPNNEDSAKKEDK